MSKTKDEETDKILFKIGNAKITFGNICSELNIEERSQKCPRLKMKLLRRIV